MIDGWNLTGSNPKNNVPIQGIEMLILFVFAMLIMMLIIWGFYMLLYGNFLGKLKKNYQELQKIES